MTINSIGSTAVWNQQRLEIMYRVAALTLELYQLGDSTPPPYNYPYHRVELRESGYVLLSEDRKGSYQIPRRISALYSPEEHRSFNEMITCLDNYFRIKKEIYDLEHAPSHR